GWGGGRAPRGRPGSAGRRASRASRRAPAARSHPRTPSACSAGVPARERSSSYGDPLMLAILRQRNFALLWSASLISKIGDMVLLIALPFYVYDLTGSTLASGGMLIAETLPRVLIGSFAG